jgi:hypothetical protein
MAESVLYSMYIVHLEPARVRKRWVMWGGGCDKSLGGGGVGKAWWRRGWQKLGRRRGGGKEWLLLSATQIIFILPPLSYQRSAASIILQCHCLYIQQIIIDPFIEHSGHCAFWTVNNCGQNIRCHLTGDMKKVRISAYFCQYAKRLPNPYIQCFYTAMYS